jgi:hypothetical protein
MLNWQELIKNAPLGHKARNKRAANLLQDLLQGHTANSHGVAGASPELDQTANQGAWRFLDNKHLKLPALYQPVHAALQQSIAVGQRAYILHDVSVVDYSRHDRKEDLCIVGDGRGYGYELFSSFVLDCTGKPLGCLGSELRTMQGLLSWQTSEVLPFVDHLEQAERAVAAAALVLPGRELVHVADREFDDLQLLRRSKHSLFIIRAQHLNRKVWLGEQKLSLREATLKVALHQAGTVKRRQDFTTKEYELYQGETEVIFAGKSLRGVANKGQSPQTGEPLCVRVVVTELRREGEETLRWVLLTNLTDSISEVVKGYVSRWLVERLFFLEKVGFKLESWHQENGNRIARRLALVQLAAMVLYELLKLEPDEPMWELLQAIARLGGHKGKKKRRPLSPTALMRGLMRLWAALDALADVDGRTLKRWRSQLQELFGTRRDSRRRHGVL